MAQTKKDRLTVLGMAPVLAEEVANQIADSSGGGGVSWGDITDKPAVIASGADAASARTAIGAGTSSLVIGTTATTAKAGNAVQTATQTTATAISPGTATNVQAILVELAARISALESA